MKRLSRTEKAILKEARAIREAGQPSMWRDYQVEDVALSLPLQDLVEPDPVTEELYGYRKFVPSRDKIKRALHRRLGIEPDPDEIDYVEGEVELRLARTRR